jgi:SNF2 family DNA or RNA helicase
LSTGFADQLISAVADSMCCVWLQVLANPASFDVAVTTYDMITSNNWGTALSRTITWRYLVLDEGHKIKNEHTGVSAAMRHVS